MEEELPQHPQTDTQAVTPTTSRSETSPSQPVMCDQPSPELLAQAMDVSSSGEKTSPGTQALEPQVPITVRGTEIRSLVPLQASQVGHPPFQIRRVEELTVGLTTETQDDHAPLDTESLLSLTGKTSLAQEVGEQHNNEQQCKHILSCPLKGTVVMVL